MSDQREAARIYPQQSVTLYKHGVGFFVRQGAVSGASVALAFRQDEIIEGLG